MSHQPDNIFAGTQVVSLVEVRGPNQSLVHPRGAVGVVTRTPAVESEKFLVRFPDGFEKALARPELEVLKHFKDRLGKNPTLRVTARVFAPPSGRSAGLQPALDVQTGKIIESQMAVDVNSFDVSRSQTGAPGQGADAPQSDALKNESPTFELEPFIILRCIVGSRAYGLDTNESDTDRRGVYLAPAELQWSLFGAPEQFEDNGTQSCYWELQKFIIMALRANPNILECLYSPLVEKATPLGAELLALREKFLSQMIFQTFNGYALSQFKKIEQDIRNHGEVRWKHAMHLLRLLLTGAATLREARVPVRVEAHRDRLLTIKRGELPWSEVDAWRKELHHDFERALAETKLPERPDYEAANGFLIKARRETSKNFMS